MLVAYLVFARDRRAVSLLPRFTQREDSEPSWPRPPLPALNASEEPVVQLIDSWYPGFENPSVASLDTYLASNSIPPSSHLSSFCFTRKAKFETLAASAPRESLSYSFTLTTANGANGPERAYGYCLRHQAFNPVRADLTGDTVESLCIISRVPLHRFFTEALKILRVRRALNDRASELDFLRQLQQATPPTSTNLIQIRSAFGGVASRHDLYATATPSLAPLFQHTNPHVLYYSLGALLLERRVVFIAKTETIVSEVISILLSLLSDLKINYPHVLIPVLPLNLQEVGVSGPTPYVVGILKAHLKPLDTLRNLGDFVIVDLDRKDVRVTEGGTELTPLGANPKLSSSNEETNLANPWSNVCDQFMKDVNAAYANKDVDLLDSAVRSVILLVTYGRGLLVEEPSIRNFHTLFSKTQIFIEAMNSRASAGMAAMLGSMRGGYVGMRNSMVSQAVQANGPDRVRSAEAVSLLESLLSTLVDESTSAPLLQDLARRSFDAPGFTTARALLVAKIVETEGRSWKQGYRALTIAETMVRIGSESIISTLWDTLGAIFSLTRFSAHGSIGVAPRAEEMIRKRASSLYGLLIRLEELRWSRSISGHLVLRRKEQERNLGSAHRMPERAARVSDTKALLKMMRPHSVAATVEEDQSARSTSPIHRVEKLDSLGTPDEGKTSGTESSNPFDNLVDSSGSLDPKSFMETTEMSLSSFVSSTQGSGTIAPSRPAPALPSFSISSATSASSPAVSVKDVRTLYEKPAAAVSGEIASPASAGVSVKDVRERFEKPISSPSSESVASSHLASSVKDEKPFVSVKNVRARFERPPDAAQSPVGAPERSLDRPPGIERPAVPERPVAGVLPDLQAVSKLQRQNPLVSEQGRDTTTKDEEPLHARPPPPGINRTRPPAPRFPKKDGQD